VLSSDRGSIILLSDLTTVTTSSLLLLMLLLLFLLLSVRELAEGEEVDADETEGVVDKCASEWRHTVASQLTER
jgi:hypothetical protein